MSVLGVDIGGTFTDFVLFDGEDYIFLKIPSTPHNPALAFLRGLEILGSKALGASILHGTTVGTNAVLERKGARTALLATRGFEDVIEIGRQTRSDLYSLRVEKPEPLIPPELRFGVGERIGPQGEVLEEVSDREISELVGRLKEKGVEAAAVCLLFSFRNPAHEERIGRKLAEAGIPHTLSSSLLPEFREYERCSAAALNSYLLPIMSRYLSFLEEKGVRLRMMHSAGGTFSSKIARERPVLTLLSGPAAGVMGARYWAGISGFESFISFDMGGTSADISLCSGGIPLTSRGEIGGYPLRVPHLDITSCGAGGGSVAWFDRGGALRVGPESAGADPGPACYGRGAKPTVTDAHLVLGHILPEHFLGGRMRLFPERAFRVLGEIAAGRGLELRDFASGILEVADSNMERSLRAISAERGFDPQDFVLVAFGGAGGLHACSLARRLGIRKILFPPKPSLLSAFGLLASPASRELSRTLLVGASEISFEHLAREMEELVRRGLRELSEEGVRGEVERELLLEMRYSGQSHEIAVPFGPDFLEEFHRRHAALFGCSFPEREAEIVNLRAFLREKLFPPPPPPFIPSGPRELGRRRMFVEGEEREVPVFRREGLSPGTIISPPALVLEPESTILLLPPFRAEVGEHGELLAEG